MSATDRIAALKRGSNHADPPNRFDYKATQLLSLRGATPATHSNRTYFHKPFDQGSLGSCVAMAVAQGLYSSLRRQGFPAKVASRLAIYYLARATHKMQKYDTGTHIRAAFQMLNKFGFADEELWPYVIANFAKMPPTKVFSAGFDKSAAKKLTKYWRIHETGFERKQAVKSALSQGYAIAYGMDVDEDFVRSPALTAWDGPTGPIIGGHAMCFVGYDEVGPESINSWGDKWSGDGFYRMTWEALMHIPRDIWVCEQAPPPKPKA